MALKNPIGYFLNTHIRILMLAALTFSVLLMIFSRSLSRFLQARVQIALARNIDESPESLSLRSSLLFSGERETYCVEVGRRLHKCAGV